MRREMLFYMIEQFQLADWSRATLFTGFSPTGRRENMGTRLGQELW